LLAYTLCNGVQPRATTTRQNYTFHNELIILSIVKSTILGKDSKKN
jgi:hypothetical protein